MKSVGIIGGLSPESTRHYYQWLCDGVREAKGGLNYPEIILATVNQQFVYENKKAGNWDVIAEKLVEKARILEQSGADYLLIATNTMHNVASAIESAVSIPLLHIVDVTADRIIGSGLSKVGMLSTIESAELPFYREGLSAKGIELVVPKTREDREMVDHIINAELCKGEVKEDSKQVFLQQVQAMIERGAQGIIMGCTEVGMLVSARDFSCPVFDTTRIHVDEALRLILDQEPAPKTQPLFRSGL